ncbi:2,3-dihydro-2,3-dihydroxybenzoate dehydrogenase [Paenibacillus sp. HB172176]|uniref:2,3-dihydro-2,3-dihydroxybenzoate dehydrogenase n=1 Tax=Paenibacillus sp. HB172176 TaxID=2493690 RepID=UPI00143A9360|nr:2,3-dihydro-2,3-dihydroxybenzoate dehydrogenase [Paenibacillus sp. HB172176]
MDKEFAGKLALVTGAAQGIGAEVARSLCRQGATVAAIDKQLEPLERMCAELRAEGGGVHAVQLDVSDHAEVEVIVARLEEELGPIAILVHAAGVLKLGALESFSAAAWSEIMAVNAGGVFHLTRAVSARMIPRRSGVVVTVSSNAASVPRVDMGAYAASKAAATMLTKCFGLELARHGIRCNIVSPGSTDTPMLRDMWQDSHGAELIIEGSLAAYKTGIPLGKLATPQDIASGVLFLASERSGHLTMHDLRIDGGATLGV